MTAVYRRANPPTLAEHERQVLEALPAEPVRVGYLVPKVPRYANAGNPAECIRRVLTELAARGLVDRVGKIHDVMWRRKA